MEKLGLIHAYTGDGKGKTTAAVGLCVRAAGRGLRVVFCQFLKGRASGELEPLERLGVTLMRMQDPEAQMKFTFQMTEAELEESRRQHRELLERAKAAAASGAYDLVVLDEAIVHRVDRTARRGRSAGADRGEGARDRAGDDRTRGCRRRWPSAATTYPRSSCASIPSSRGSGRAGGSNTSGRLARAAARGVRPRKESGRCSCADLSNTTRFGRWPARGANRSPSCSFWR